MGALGNVIDKSAWLDPWLYQQKVLHRDRAYLSEHHLYGSSRLGMQKYLPSAVGYEPHPAQGAWAPQRLVERRGWYSRLGGDVFMESNYGGALSTDQVFERDTVTRRHLLGHRHYELSDHLGNVRATVLDKTGLDLWKAGTVSLKGYGAQVSSAVDYYPFGQPMPGRSYGDSISKCVPVGWQVWLDRTGWFYLEDTHGGGVVRAEERPYGTERGNEDSLGYLSGGGNFRGEVLQVYHSRERKPGEEPAVVVAYDRAVDTGGGVASTVGYKLDLGGEPSEGVRVFLGVPVAVEGDGDAVSLRYRLEGVGEEVVAQARVRQYYGANGPGYYPLLDWQEVEGSGEQELQLPIDRERVARGGRTYVEWRFARRGGGKFDEQSLVYLEALAVDRTRWGWYTRTVMSCEQEDNYRYGFNGQERVDEISGRGNHTDYGARGYDTRLGRWWSVDPLAAKYPGMSPYNFTGNNPILFVDYDGKDFGVKINHDAKTIILVQNVYTVSQNAYSQALKGAEQWNNKVTEVGGYKVSFQINVVQPYQTTRQEVVSANPPDLYKKNGRVNNNVMERSQQDRNTFKGESNAQKDPIGNLYYGNIGVDSRTVNGENFVGGYTRDGKAISMNNHHTYADQQSFGDMGSYADLVSHEIGHTFGLDHPAGGVMEYGGVNLKPISDNDVSEIIKYTNDRLTNGNESGAKVKMIESVGKPSTSSPVQH